MARSAAHNEADVIAEERPESDHEREHVHVGRFDDIVKPLRKCDKAQQRVRQLRRKRTDRFPAPSATPYRAHGGKSF